MCWFGIGCALICAVGIRWLRSRFVVAWGVGASLTVAVWLLSSYGSTHIHDLAILHRPLIWGYGLATPLGLAAAALAFSAQFRAMLCRLRLGGQEELRIDSVDEESMNLISLSLARLGYPLILSGLLLLVLGSLGAVGRGWFWQRMVAAQLFTLVVYAAYLHLAASETRVRIWTFFAHLAGFCGVLISVISFDLPQGLLRGLGLTPLL